MLPMRQRHESGQQNKGQDKRPDVQQVLRLLQSPDIQISEEATSVLKEQLSSSGDWYGVVIDEYVNKQSSRILELLANVREPQDKVFLDKLCEILKPHPRCTLMLMSHVVQRQPSWLPKLTGHSFFTHLLRFLKQTAELLHLVSGLYLLSSVLPQSPLLTSQLLQDLFQVFFSVCQFVHLHFPNDPHAAHAALAEPRRAGEKFVPAPDLNVVYREHLGMAVEAYFQRLYGIYPCNFLTYLRTNFNDENVHHHSSRVDKRVIFKQIVRPLLSKVKIHPNLVLATKDKEMSRERWMKKEPHDIIAECNQMTLNRIEECGVETEREWGAERVWGVGGGMGGRLPSNVSLASSHLSFFGVPSASQLVLPTNSCNQSLNSLSVKVTPMKVGEYYPDHASFYVHSPNIPHDGSSEGTGVERPVAYLRSPLSPTQKLKLKNMVKQRQTNTTDGPSAPTDTEHTGESGKNGHPLVGREVRVRRNLSEALSEPLEEEGGTEEHPSMGSLLWSPSMAVGMGTPPESVRTTPTSQLLTRRDSLKQHFTSSLRSSEEFGKFGPATIDGSRRATASGGELLGSRKSFGQSFSNFFRPNTVSPNSASAIGTGGGSSAVSMNQARRSMPPRVPSGTVGGTSSVPPSPLKPLSSSFFQPQQTSTGCGTAFSFGTDIPLVPVTSPSGPQKDTASKEHQKLKPTDSPEEIIGVAQSHRRQGSQASQAEEAVEATEVLRQSSDEEKETGGPSQPRRHQPSVHKSSSYTLAQLESVAHKLQFPADKTDAEVSSLLSSGTKDDVAKAEEHVTRIPVGGEMNDVGGNKEVGLSRPRGPMECSAEIRIPEGDRDRRPSMIAEDDEDDTGSPPRLATSGSVVDFFKKINRMRFQSECGTSTKGMEGGYNIDEVDAESGDEDGLLLNEEDIDACTIRALRPVPRKESVGEDEVLPRIRKRSLSCPTKLRRPTSALRNNSRMNDYQDSSQEGSQGGTLERDKGKRPNSAVEQLRVKNWKETVPVPTSTYHGFMNKVDESSSPEEEHADYDSGISGNQQPSAALPPHEPLLDRQWLFQILQQYPYLPLLPNVLPSPNPLSSFPEHDRRDGVSLHRYAYDSGFPSSSAVSIHLPADIRDHPALLDEYLRVSEKAYRHRVALEGGTDWTHFGFEEPPSSPGGAHSAEDYSPHTPCSASATKTVGSRTGRNTEEENEILKTQLALLEQRFLYEKFRRTAHAQRNRKLFARLKQQTSLEAQVNCNRKQLDMQKMEIKRFLDALSDQRKLNADQKEIFHGHDYSLNKQLCDKIKDIDRLKRETDDLRREVDSYRCENDQLRKQLGSSKQELFNAEEDVKQLKDSATESQQLRVEMKQLETELLNVAEAQAASAPVFDYLCQERNRRECLEAKIATITEGNRREIQELRRQLRKERQKAESARQGALDLEAQIHKRFQEIRELKNQEEVLKETHKEHLTALDQKYRALVTVCTRQEAHMSDLYRSIAQLSRVAATSTPASSLATEDVRFGLTTSRMVTSSDALAASSGIVIPERPGPREIQTPGSYGSWGRDLRAASPAESCRSESAIPPLPFSSFDKAYSGSTPRINFCRPPFVADDSKPFKRERKGASCYDAGQLHECERF